MGGIDEHRLRGPAVTLKISPEHPTFKLILRELAVHPASCLDLEVSLGINHRNIANHIKFGRDAHVIRIAGWEPGVKGGRPLYGIKNGPPHRDCRRPKRMTDAEAMRQWRDRHPEQKSKAAIKRLQALQSLVGGTKSLPRYRSDCGSKLLRSKG